MKTPNTDAIRDLAEGIAHLLDGSKADIAMSAMLTVIVGMCAQFADDKTEFQDFLLKAASCIATSSSDNTTSTTH